MKNIFSIVVLGLLLSGNAYALNFTPLKELTKKDWSNPTNDMHLSMQLKETIRYS